MIGAAADSVKLDQATLLNLAKVIRAKNLNCTEPLAAYDMGQDALGVVTRIECSSATFRVTKRPDGSVDVARGNEEIRRRGVTGGRQQGGAAACELAIEGMHQD